MTPRRFQIREDLASLTPEARERNARLRFWRKLVVMTLGVLAMAMAAVQLFLREQADWQACRWRPPWAGLAKALGPAEQRMAVHIHAIEDHLADIAW